jgi:HEAT repeat protein
MRSVNLIAHGLKPWAGAVAVTLWIAASLAGQRVTDNSVNQLRQILQTTGQTPADRDRHLKKLIEALHDLHELRQALELAEWNYEDWDKDRLRVNQVNQATVAKRFADQVGAELRDGDKARRLAILALLRDMSTATSGVLRTSRVGRDLSADLADLIRRGEPQVCEAAAETLGGIQPDPAVAVPVLSDALRAQEAPPRLAAAQGLVHLMRATLRSAGGVRGTAMREAVRKDLVTVGSAVVPVVAQGVSDPCLEVRRLCLETLGLAAAALYQLADDPRLRSLDAEERESGQQVQQEWEQMLPLVLALKDQGTTLSQALHDPEAVIRLGVGQVLETLAVSRNRLVQRAFRAGVTLAVPCGAAPAEGTGAKEVRLVVFRVPLPPADDPLLAGLSAVLPALTVGVYDPDARVRLKVVEVLETLGPAALPAAPALVRALGDPDRFVRWAAARALGKLGPVEAVVAVPALEQLLADADLDVRRTAASTLEAYREAARPALAGLIRTLRTPDPILKAAALRTLKGIGSEAEPALPALRSAREDPDARVRQLAGEVLDQLEAMARQAPAEPGR